MTRCNKNRSNVAAARSRNLQTGISKKLMRRCEVWTATRFRVDRIAVKRDFQPRMTRCSKNKNLDAAQQIF
jgi:hypothetical protein